MRPFVILGTGGHAHVVIDLIRRPGWSDLRCVGHGADSEQSLPGDVNVTGYPSHTRRRLMRKYSFQYS